MNTFACFLILGMSVLFNYQKEAPPSADKYITQVVRECSVSAQKKYGLTWAATASCQESEEIKEISVVFSKKNDFSSIAEARKLEITLVQLFSNIINANKNIRPYLTEYPFPLSRIKVKVSGSHKDPTDKVVSVAYAHDKLVYQAYDGKKLYDIYKESYQDALKVQQ